MPLEMTSQLPSHNLRWDQFGGPKTSKNGFAQPQFVGAARRLALRRLRVRTKALDRDSAQVSVVRSEAFDKGPCFLIQKGHPPTLVAKHPGTGTP